MKKVFMVALVLLASVVTGQNVPSQKAADVPAEKPLAEPPVPLFDEAEMLKLVRERRGNIQDVFASAAPPAPAVPAAAAPPPKPTAPPLPFTYLGRMKNGERHIVYLLKGGEMVLAEGGMTIDAYRVESVSDAAVQFVYLPLETRQSLSLPAPQ